VKSYVGIVILSAVVIFVTMEVLSRSSEQERPVPIINASQTRTQTKKPAATQDEVISLSFRELTADPTKYVGKRITVKETLILWALTSYYQFACSSGNCPGMNPHNPRCEYLVQLQVFSPSSPIIQGCVPRSKVGSLSGAWSGETGVRIVGVVAPTQDAAGWVFMRDVLLIQPRENTSEAWPK
jgi:hypothetical protein